MSEDEATGWQTEVGTLDVVLALSRSNKKQSPKKEGTGQVVISSASIFAKSSPLSPFTMLLTCH